MYSVFLQVYFLSQFFGMSRVNFPVYFDLMADELGSFNLLQR